MELTKESLTKTELTALKRCEQTVAKHEKSAIAYVDALREIRDKRIVLSVSDVNGVTLWDLAQLSPPKDNACTEHLLCKERWQR